MAAWYDEEQEAQARAYDRAQARLFILRFGLLFALATAFWLSGFSRALAAGLKGLFLFPLAWPLVCASFTALAVFGYEAVLFPLSVLADYSLERAHGRLEAEFGTWLKGFVLTLLIEIVIVTAGFTGLYVLMYFFPVFWWLAATGAYAVLVAGLGEWGPAVLLPRVRPPKAVDDPVLLAELQRVGREAGLEIEGAARWDFEHQEELEEVRLGGWGRRRCVIFSERVWRELGHRERVFLAARQMAWLRHGLRLGVQTMQVVLAGGVFFGAGWLTDWAAHAKGLPSAAVPEAFPFWVVALFALAALAGVAAHAVIRRVELGADRFALRHAGGAEALRSCLQHEFEQAPFAMDEAGWQVALLRNRPTPAGRLAQAIATERAPASTAETPTA